jgi:hypothetical protein
MSAMFAQSAQMPSRSKQKDQKRGTLHRNSNPVRSALPPVRISRSQKYSRGSGSLRLLRPVRQDPWRSFSPARPVRRLRGPADEPSTASTPDAGPQGRWEARKFDFCGLRGTIFMRNRCQGRNLRLIGCRRANGASRTSWLEPLFSGCGKIGLFQRRCSGACECCSAALMVLLLYRERRSGNTYPQSR